MEAILKRCCGMGVHKKSITACLVIEEVDGHPREEIRSFSTMTEGLIELRDWLLKAGCTHVAMESTGSYWKPVFNILEEHFTVVLANARNIKHVPGRKSDVQDCQWIAQLLRCGLIRGSFIPPKPIRELRDLTRYRKRLIQDATSERNRIQKVLEDANIKLASVLSDLFGVSGQDMLKALLDGQGTPEEIAKLARGRLKAKIPKIEKALGGSFQELGEDYLDRAQDESYLRHHIRRLEKLGYQVILKPLESADAQPVGP